jgi:hypothetical protein
MAKELTYRFSAEKNILLKKERDVSFDDIIYCIEQGYILDIVRSTSRAYMHQEMYIVELNGYAYVIPFVREKNEVFLKTIYPSRTMTARYLLKDRI